MAEENAFARLGILFVHGIGGQPEGETLWRFGEPLVRWLSTWLKRGQDPNKAGDPVKITWSIINPAQRFLRDPAHALVDVESREPGNGPQRWLLAESWWGAELQRPAFRKVATWMLTTGTWMILSHALWRGRLLKKGVWRGARQFLAAVLSLPVAGLTQLGVLLLMILALLPVKRLRDFLSGLLLRLTGVLGDSYVFVENQIQQAAIITKVREDLSWLAERCTSVVVVAHSQGAAVAHRALRTQEPENVELLVTVGSGLAKLEELESVASRRPGRLQWAAICIPLTILFALTAVRSFNYPPSAPPWLQWLDLRAVLSWVCGLLALFSLLMAVIFVQAYAETIDVRALTLSRLRKRIKWFDLYAGRDPVPNGPLVKDGQIEGFSSQSVTNGMSMLQDHTSYWENSADLLPKIFTKMDTELHLGLFRSQDDDDDEKDYLDHAAVMHRRRVGWKAAVFYASVLGGLLFVMRLWRPTLVGLGQAVWPRLDHGVLALVGKPLKVAVDTIAPILSWLFGSRDFRTLGMGLLGAVVPVALVTAWYTGYRQLWSWWDGRAIRQAFLARPGQARKGDSWVATSLVAMVGFLPLGLAILLFVHPEWLAPGKLEGRLLLILGTFLVGWLAFGWVMVLAGACISLYRSPPAEKKESVKSLLFVLVAGMGWFLFLASSNLPWVKIVKDWAGALLMVAASLAFFSVGHGKILHTAALKGRRGRLWWVALVLPLALAAAFCVPLVAVMKVGEAIPTDIGFAFIYAYGFGLAVAWAVVRLMTRAERRIKSAADKQKAAAPDSN